MKSNPRLLQLEKARAQQQRPNAAKKKKENLYSHNFPLISIVIASVELLTLYYLDQSLTHLSHTYRGFTLS